MSASPPPFKKICPCPVLPPPFLIFQILPSEGSNQTLLPPLKKVCVFQTELAKKTPEQSFYC